jgi:uncharacterized membrane protein (UPF0127 family)
LAGDGGSGAPVRVVNVTRGNTLAERATLARGFFARARGLLGRRGLEPGEGLVLAPCGSIHMIGMRFAIDAVFVDGVHSGGRVLRVARLAPGMLGPLVRGARAVIELPAGAAGATAPGDEVRWQPLPLGSPSAAPAHGSV